MPVDEAQGSEPIHLIHIGYAKAGSTFLQHWFEAHPEIAFVHGGLAGYANVWDVARQACVAPPHPRCRVTSAEQLGAPYAVAGTDVHHERDFTPPDLQAEERVCAELAHLFPTAHVLLVTRGFLGTVASSHSQHVREAGTIDFHVARRAAPPDVLARALDYDQLVRTYRQAFGDRLLVLPYELLRDDPSAFLDRLQRRLGLTTPGPMPGRLNESLSGVELRWYPRLSRLVLGAPVPTRFRQRVADAWTVRTRRNGMARLIRILQRVLPATPVDPYAIDEGELIAGFAGKAESLRDDADYAAYHHDYLLDVPGP
jgi:hypothetical protein